MNNKQLTKGYKMKKIAMVLIMLSTLSVSAEALEHRCEVDQWGLSHCRWIITRF